MKIIKNGIIYDVINNTSEVKTLYIKDGKFVDYLAEGEIIDATGLHIYPGFIDAHTHLGIWESSIGFEGSDFNESNSPITPNLRGIDGVYPIDEAFSDAYKAGITTVATGPGSANVMGGTFFALKTYGHNVDKMVVKDPVAMKIAFGENPKKYHTKSNNTRMQVAASIREMLNKTIDYMKNDRPYDAKLESLIPVIKKEIPFKIHAHRSDDILTAIRICREFDLDYTLDHVTEGHLIIEELEEINKPLLVGPTLTSKSKYELKNRSFKTYAALQHLNISVITDAPVIPIDQLRYSVIRAMQEGFTKENALRSITINPAKALKIEESVGSIEVGKDADLVLLTKEFDDIQAEVKYTLINGEIIYKKV